MRRITIIISAAIIIGISFYFLNNSYLIKIFIANFEGLSSELAAVVPIRSLASVTDIVDFQSDYGKVSTEVRNKKIRILIVPGHEPDFGGTEFGDLYERNLTAELGKDLRQFLQSDGAYQTFITRDTQSWSPVFADYFKNNWDGIAVWVKTSKKNKPSPALVAVPASVPKVAHNKAPNDVALRIYGINKWANENDINLTIHIHLNNYPRRSERIAGKYSGLVIYAPAQQYSNSTATHLIAESVFKRLSMYNPINDLPAESSGVVDDSELIAVGVNNTSDAASMLIEYDYIYQPQFIDPEIRNLALKDLAYQTYLGLQDFFSKNNNVFVANSYNPALLYEWNNPETDKNSNPADIYALQTALIMDGVYPPSDKSKNDCPHSGFLGKCTLAALKEFQNKYGIIDENGIVGKKTFNLLNGIYFKRIIK